VVFMSCHNAIWEQTAALIKAGINPDKLSHPALAAELTKHLLGGIVLIPGVACTLPDTAVGLTTLHNVGCCDASSAAAPRRAAASLVRTIGETHGHAQLEHLSPATHARIRKLPRSAPIRSEAISPWAPRDKRPFARSEDPRSDLARGRGHRVV
jgi:hypothetical protein